MFEVSILSVFLLIGKNIWTLQDFKLGKTRLEIFKHNAHIILYFIRLIIPSFVLYLLISLQKKHTDHHRKNFFLNFKIIIFFVFSFLMIFFFTSFRHDLFMLIIFSVVIFHYQYQRISLFTTTIILSSILFVCLFIGFIRSNTTEKHTQETNHIMTLIFPHLVD